MEYKGWLEQNSRKRGAAASRGSALLGQFGVKRCLRKYERFTFGALAFLRRAGLGSALLRLGRGLRPIAKTISMAFRASTNAMLMVLAARLIAYAYDITFLSFPQLVFGPAFAGDAGDGVETVVGGVGYVDPVGGVFLYVGVVAVAVFGLKVGTEHGDGYVCHSFLDFLGEVDVAFVVFTIDAGQVGSAVHVGEKHDEKHGGNKSRFKRGKNLLFRGYIHKEIGNGSGQKYAGPKVGSWHRFRREHKGIAGCQKHKGP